MNSIISFSTIKKITFTTLFIAVSHFSSSTTTYTIGASGDDYTTIAAAYTACSGATDYIIEVQSDYDYATESTAGTVTITLGALASKNSTNTVTIRPASGVSLSLTGTVSSIFTLDAATWVIIDGRAGGAGASAWTIINSSSSASKRVFTFINDASNNVIKYCLIKGDNSSTSTNTAGLILFSTTTGTTGNDSNTINNCTLQQNVANPGCLIQSNGTSAKTNSSNTISNCDLVNAKMSAIWIDTYSDTWTITDNNMYQSASQTPSTDVKLIFIDTGSGHTITGNYIGGQAASCTGNNFTLATSAFQIHFIYFGSNSSGGTTNVISNNTITNINVTNTYESSADATSACSIIYTSGTSNFTIGSSGNGNTIGNTSGVASGTQGITLACNGTPLFYSNFTAIHVTSSGTHSVAYNTIGAITYSTSTTDNFDDISLVRITTTGAATISNNTFGNTTANNITITSKSYDFYVVYQDNQATALTINDNTFQNLTVVEAGAGTNTSLWGIYTQNGSLTLSIYNNIFTSFTLNCAAHDADANFAFGSLMAAYCYGGGANNWNVYDNTISNFTHTYSAGNLITVMGLRLQFTAGAGNLNVYKNKVTTLTNASTNSGSGLCGIYTAYSGSGSASIYNNVVLLSDGSNTVSKTTRGILDYNGGGTTRVYHNTVKLFATYTSGSGSTAAFTYGNNGATHKVKNNVWQNLCSGGTGGHYAQRWVGTYATPSNIRNNYNQVTADANKLCYWAANKSLADWRTALSDAGNTELDGSITISSTTGVPSTSVTIGNAGADVSADFAVATDFDDNIRTQGSPWMGAFETIVALPIELISFTVKANRNKVDLQWETSTEFNNDFFTIERTLDGHHFETVSIVKGGGNSTSHTTYFSEDVQPYSGISYYRLTQTDYDGTSKSYDLKSVNFKVVGSDEISLYPNPIEQNQQLTISLAKEQTADYYFINIYNTNGILCYSETLYPENQNSKLHLDLNNNLESGSYLVILSDSNETKMNKLLLIR